MSKVICKYVLQLQDSVEVDMPVGAEVLSVHMRPEGLCLWALVETRATQDEKRTFRIAGTGPIYDIFEGMRTETSGGPKYEFIGTVLDEQFVWHVFEVTK